jgi:Ca-activated chloride channel family protein
MRFASPSALLWLLLVPLCLMLYWRWRRPVTIAYSAIQDLATLPPSFMIRLHRVLPWLRTLVFLLCILALARPQWGIKATRVYTQGIAIDMVVDVSRSMEAQETQPDGRRMNRLEVVKEAFRTFVQGRDGSAGRERDLIGMVTFARYADSICPLTLDHAMLLALLERIEIVTLPEENGTAIGEAIALGVDRLHDSTTTSRVLILLTDGSNNAGETEPLRAAQIAKALGIKIYTIGAGVHSTPAMAVQASSDRRLRQQAPLSIDEDTLWEVARLTGGQYFRATDSAGLQAVYAEINQLEKSSTVAEHYQQYVEIFPLPLLLGLGLLLLEIVLMNTRWRTIP